MNWKNWNFMRAFRGIMGIVALVYAIVTKDTILGVAGGFLLFMAIANIGCSGAGSCAMPQRRTRTTGRKINYEKLDIH